MGKLPSEVSMVSYAIAVLPELIIPSVNSLSAAKWKNVNTSWFSFIRATSDGWGSLTLTTRSDKE